MAQLGFGLIGVVKTAAKNFPMNYLSEVELKERGNSYSLVSLKEGTDVAEMTATVWMDRDRRYFIGDVEGMDAGQLTYRLRWRQNDPDQNADPERVELEVPTPKMIEQYYNMNDVIDQLNLKGQNDLEI